MRHVTAGVLALALLATGCGGDDEGAGGPARLVWDGTPVVRSSTTGARVLIGKVRNESSRKLRITARQVTVADGRGRTLESSAVFISTFVRSNYPHNMARGSDPADYPEAEQRRVGFLAVLDAGESTPLTVSWNERPREASAKRIVYGPASLTIPPRITSAAG
jgi:hypothetical protein